MFKFYDLSIISKILNNFKVDKIILTGSPDEKIVNEILKYSKNVTAINLTELKSIKTIIDYPLNALKNQKNYNAIFINDDSNWYTVFNELNIIKDTNNEFPLIFLCNNKFPNKRRDSYSNPEKIPKEFRHENSEKLPIYYKNERINVFDGFYHATDENTPKNGVLTAIEDFISENNDIGIMDIHFLEEITILYPKNQSNQERIENIFKNSKGKEITDIDLPTKLIENELLVSYIDKHNISNEELNKLKMEISKKDTAILDYKNKIRNNNNELNYKNSQIEGIESKLSLKDSQIKNIESKLINKKITINGLQDEIKNKQQELNMKEKELNSLQHIHIKQMSKIDNKEYCISCFKEEISNNHTEIRYLKNNTLTKKVLSPFGYLYLILKSKPNEVSLNLNLYKALKDSKCFDIGFYLNKNPDLIESKWCKYFSPELHYVCNGFNEERKFNKKYFNRDSKKDLLEYLLTCEK